MYFNCMLPTGSITRSQCCEKYSLPRIESVRGRDVPESVLRAVLILIVGSQISIEYNGSCRFIYYMNLELTSKNFISCASEYIFI